MAGAYEGHSPAAKALYWEAIRLLKWMLPKPYSYISAYGFGMRKLRLERELAEFDQLHNEWRGEPARLDQLVCAGLIILAWCRGALPLQGELLINPHWFEGLMSQVESRLEGLAAD